jgi:hypothetical protein
MSLALARDPFYCLALHFAEGMLFKPLRLLEKRRLQLQAVHALRPQELSHGPTALERQVATEEDSVD